MSNKQIIPRNLIYSSVESYTDNHGSVKLKVYFKFMPDLETWFRENLGNTPNIMLSKYDLGHNYFVEFPSSEISLAFKIAWL